MRTSFNNFLNESVSKLQCVVSKDELDEFKENVKLKSDELNIKVDIFKTSGVSSVKVLLRASGEPQSTKEFSIWLKENY